MTQTKDAPLPGTFLMISPGSVGAVEAFATRCGGVPEALVLVEPDAEVAGDLRRRLHKHAGLRLIEASVGATAGEAELVRYNFPGLRSVQSPTPALQALLPGLKPQSRQRVRVISPATLLTEAGALPRPLRLHIDAPGAELDILEALHAAGTLSGVEEIILHCGAAPFFEHSPTCAQLLEFLKTHGFRLQQRLNDDPDLSVLHLSVDQAARHLEALERQSQAHREQIAELEQAHQAALAKVEAARAAIERKASAQAKQLAELEQTHQATVAKVKAARPAAERKATAQAKQLAELEQAHQAASAEVEAARAAAERKAAAQAEQITHLQAAQQKREAELAHSANLRKMMQVDLDQLRHRFEASETQRLAREQLLRQLTPTLARVAEQVHDKQPSQKEAKPAPTNQHATPPLPEHTPRAAPKPPQPNKGPDQ